MRHTSRGVYQKRPNPHAAPTEPDRRGGLSRAPRGQVLSETTKRRRTLLAQLDSALVCKELAALQVGLCARVRAARVSRVRAARVRARVSSSCAFASHTAALQEAVASAHAAQLDVREVGEAEAMVQARSAKWERAGVVGEAGEAQGVGVLGWAERRACAT